MTERKERCKCPTGSPGWMATFADMNSLLLTFFIAILSSGEVDPIELRLVLSSFEGSFGSQTGGTTLSTGTLLDMGNTIESLPSQVVGSHLSRHIADVSESLKPDIKSKKVRVQEINKGYKITLASDMFFRPGSAEIDYTEGKDTLRKIGQMLYNSREDPYRVEIIGHTDNTPIPPTSTLYKRFPSNWELSTARAAAVVRYLIDFGVDPGRFYAEGRADNDPLESNDTPEGRSYNRRIDIYLSFERDK